MNAHARYLHELIAVTADRLAAYAEEARTNPAATNDLIFVLNNLQRYIALFIDAWRITNFGAVAGTAAGGTSGPSAADVSSREGAK